MRKESDVVVLAKLESENGWKEIKRDSDVDGDEGFFEGSVKKAEDWIQSKDLFAELEENGDVVDVMVTRSFRRGRIAKVQKTVVEDLTDDE